MKRLMVLSVVVFVFISFMTFGKVVFAESGLTKIADNVYAYVDVKKSSPQNSFGANAGIIIGSEGIAVIDTLASAKEAKRFIEDIRKVSDRRIKYVINTHYHLDHTFGNSVFKQLGATIISHVIDDQNLKSKGGAALKNAKEYGLSESDMEGTVIVYPDQTFNDGMGIDLGNQKIELFYPGNSHTDGSIFVYLQDKKILFTGDILFTNYHPFMADGDIKSWLKALDFIGNFDAVKIIPGHGPVSGKKDIEDMKNYLLTFDKEAERLSSESKDIDYVFKKIKKVLPDRDEGEWIIKANLQMKYMKK
jgi:cyclase